MAEATAVLDRGWGEQVPHAVHGWPELFGSVEALRALGARALAELQPPQVQHAGRLRALQRCDGPAPGLLHDTLCLLAPWFEGWRAEVVVPALGESLGRVRPWLDQACAWVPTLGQSRVELAWALGGRGRVLERRIVVGAPAPWNGLDDRRPVVLAMHECLVQQSEASGYAGVEWEALTKLAAILHGADTALASAHAVWLGSLELRPLLQALARDGKIDDASHCALADGDGPQRAAELAAASRGG